MSTKIYNGIKFKTNNLHELLKLLQAQKNEAVKIGLNYLRQKELYSFIFHNNLQTKDAFEITREIRNSISKSYRGTFDPNFSFSIVVFPHVSGDLYGFYLDDNIHEYSTLLFDNEIAEDFHYQNSSDCPKNISESDWDMRRDIWDELLPGIGCLRDNGFIFKMVTEDDINFELFDDIKKTCVEVAVAKEEEKIVSKLVSIINEDEDFLNSIRPDYGKNYKIGFGRNKKNEQITYDFFLFMDRTNVFITKDELDKIESDENLLNSSVSQIKKQILTNKKEK